MLVGVFCSMMAEGGAKMFRGREVWQMSRERCWRGKNNMSFWKVIWKI